jgi:hypothetical protein
MPVVITKRNAGEATEETDRGMMHLRPAADRYLRPLRGIVAVNPSGSTGFLSLRNSTRSLVHASQIAAWQSKAHKCKVQFCP